MGKKYRLIILGLGNVLFKDEGFGIHFVRDFQERYCLPEDVPIIDGGTLGYMLMDLICQTENLLVVDTVKTNEEPGTVYKFNPDAIPTTLQYNVSAHEVEFLDLLLKADMIGEAPRTTIIAVVPEDIINTGFEMTARVKKSLLKVEELIKKEITALGIPIQIKK
ncbi:MAG: HyaD/HybD family hydrogenase maturation endopeptidase [bacterium]